jgi:hypothetical protein
MYITPELFVSPVRTMLGGRERLPGGIAIEEVLLGGTKTPEEPLGMDVRLLHRAPLFGS